MIFADQSYDGFTTQTGLQVQWVLEQGKFVMFCTGKSLLTHCKIFEKRVFQAGAELCQAQHQLWKMLLEELDLDEEKNNSIRLIITS